MPRPNSHHIVNLSQSAHTQHEPNRSTVCNIHLKRTKCTVYNLTLFHRITRTPGPNLRACMSVTSSDHGHWMKARYRARPSQPNNPRPPSPRRLFRKRTSSSRTAQQCCSVFRHAQFEPMVCTKVRGGGGRMQYPKLYSM